MTRAIVWMMFFCSLLPRIGWAQAEKAPPTDELQDRQARFTFIQQKLESFDLRYADGEQRELKLTPEAVLKYTNPVRSADGIAASYLWLDGNRPVAAASLSIRQEDKVFRELVSFTSRPLILTKSGMPLWTPTSRAAEPRELLGSPAPARSAAQRLLQMRTLAREFKVKMFRDPPVDARLLPQPVHRYTDPEQGIQDAALFAFVETTDPEAFLIIEAIAPKKDTAPAWHYRFARMTSAGLEVRRGEEIVFQADPYWRNARAKTDPYQEAQQYSYGVEPPPGK